MDMVYSLEALTSFKMMLTQQEQLKAVREYCACTYSRNVSMAKSASLNQLS